MCFGGIYQQVEQVAAMEVIVGCAKGLLCGFTQTSFGNNFAVMPMSELGILRQEALIR